MADNQTVLITGCSEGIGRCFAQVFAKQGYNLVLVARNQLKLDELATELSTQYSINVQVCAADLIPPNATMYCLKDLMS